MELVGEWDNGFLNGIFSNEEHEFMAQLLDNTSVSLDDSSSGFSSGFWSGHESSTPYPNDQEYMPYMSYNNNSTNINNTMSSSYTQERIYNNIGNSYYLSDTTSNHHSSSFGVLTNNNSYSSSIDFSLGKKENTPMQGEELQLEQAVLHGKSLQVLTKETTKLSFPQISDSNNNKYLVMEDFKKRPHVSTDQMALEKKRNVKAKKNTNGKVNDSIITDASKSSCCCSVEGDDDDDSSINVTTLSQSADASGRTKSIGKARLSRGSANDPQSLYARKRRERINERLRTLQNLVPNGTKVDISTMLEEAVQYVKFLQLQIKLLSSEDLWMYAPIAYNGVDIGLAQMNTILSSTPRPDQTA